MTYALLGCSLNTGTIVVKVVEVEAIYYVIDLQFARLRLAYGEEVVLAQVTAIYRVARVPRNLEFVGFDDKVPRADQARHLECREAIVVRHRGRRGGQREHPIADSLVCDLKYEGGIDTARKGDHHRGQRAKEIAQMRELGFERSGVGHRFVSLCFGAGKGGRPNVVKYFTRLPAPR